MTEQKPFPRLSRRGFLKGAGGLSLALPLSYAGTGRAQASHPKRLVVFFTPNGTVPDVWSPYPDWTIFDGPRDEFNFPFSPILQPLEGVRDKLIVLEGLEQRSTSTGPGDGHQKGMGHMLTGTALQSGTEFQGGGDSGTAGWAGGVSVDQHIAQQIGDSTRFRSLELGVRTLGATVWSRMSYSSPGVPIPPENNPSAAFNRIFADLGADPAQLARLRLRRRSVLDAVTGEFSSLMNEVGADDRIKLDQHLTTLREIELRLEAGSQPTTSCGVPDAPDALDPLHPDNFPAVGDLQLDLMVMALACDLTRVASIMWTKSVGDVPFTWLGINDGHHALSHEGDSNTVAQDKLRQINTWYAQRFRDLIDKMAAIPEGDGTLLDHSVVLWTNELAKGNSHSRDGMPYVIAGSGDGYFRTGRYLHYGNLIVPGDPHNNLLLSLCHAMGLEDMTNFGDPLFCTGPLDGLV